MLSFVNRGCWRDVAGERILLLGSCGLASVESASSETSGEWLFHGILEGRIPQNSKG